MISSTTVLRSSTSNWPFQTWGLTHPHAQKSQRFPSGKCGGQETSDHREMILWPLSYWAVPPSCSQMSTWLMNYFQPDHIADHSQIIAGINLTSSKLACPLHPLSISSPAPFCPWVKQTHIITLIFPCLRHSSLSLGCHSAPETSYFKFWGWVKGILFLITFIYCSKLGP